MANITVDIQARVTGYQKSLSDLQSQIQKLDPGASISKNVTKAFEQASNEVKGLSKNMFPKASSDTQIDSIIEKTNRAGEAIQNVVRLLQQVTVNDLNFGNFGTEIDSFRSQIAALEQDLNTKLNQGLLSAVQGSQQLKDVFAGLGTDLSKADANTLFQDLSKGAQDAAGEVKKAQAEVDAIEKKLNDTQLSLNKNKSSILATQEGRMNLDTEIKGISDSYNNIFDSLRNTMEKGLSSALKGQNIDTKGMLDTFFKDLTPENIKGRIQNLFSQLSGSFNGAREFYKAVFGADGKAGSNINNLVNAIDLRGSIEAVKAQFQEFIAQNGGLIKPDQLPKITRLIDTDSINEAVQKTINEFDSAFGRVQKAIQEGQEKLVTQTESRDMAQKALVEAQTRQSNYDAAITNLQTELDKVKAENENLVKQIEDLRASMEQQKGSTLEDFKSTAGAIGQSARQNVFPTDEANAYKQQLDQVAAKEQALGKLQGVVQRWFSVYAAIRMVRQAIDSVISTVQELDATITEIAIVTSMDQSELWDQMPKYTQLARDYAASISGVYQVSQLYYQQGLQTAEVMALTEQTLKMARISGLDYAQATDYMTNAVRSFKMEMTDAERVVDVYSAIAASSATSVTELASAMSKTASSAQAVGSSFENTTAMMAVMIEATRESAENIGSAMKSIISRYGEMTSDPSKLVDSEGQEMSLNRVDKALQTVGISIHNAAGEFRNFDDVIMELAEKWDTIDTNTQRYIATIMAGNRQQSRFLALVSSYDRLKELSADAAESEDASQLQFLKTLDSVEAKTQQFQTSVQALYVNSGIEDLYKGILDWANQVITSLDQLSDKFGTLAVVGKIGGTFVTLATLVTNIFNTIKMSYSNTRAKIAAEGKIAAADEILNKQRVANEIAAINNQEVIDAQETQKQITEAELKEIEKRKAAEEQHLKEIKAQNVSKTKIRTTTGMLASAAGLATSTWAASIDVNENRGLKTGLTAASGILSGLGTGLMVGGMPGAILGALTALPSILEAIGMASESTAERMTKLQNAIKETNNTKIEAKSQLKTLTDYKTKFDELSAAQFSSAEAKEEFIKLQNDIAASYPELISGMDAEGNYVVNMTDAYNQLAAAKANAYKTSFISNLGAELAGLNDLSYILKSVYGQEPLKERGFNIWKSLANIVPSGGMSDLQDYIIDKSLGWSHNLNVETLRDLMADNTAEQFVTQEAIQNWGFTSGMQPPATIIEQLNPNEIEMFNNAISSLVELAKSDKALTFQQAQTQLISKSSNEREKAFIQNLREPVGEYLFDASRAANFQDLLVTSKINSSNAEYMKILQTEAEALGNKNYVANELQQYGIQQQLNTDLKAYLDRNRSRIGTEKYKDVNGKDQDVDEKRLIEEFYTGLNGERAKNLEYYNEQLQELTKTGIDDSANEIYKNLGKYSKNYITESGISDDAQALLLKALEEQYKNIFTDYSNWADNTDFKNEEVKKSLQGYVDQFSVATLQAIQKQYDGILNNDFLSDNQKTTQLTNLTNVYDEIAKISQSDYASAETLLATVQDADLTSLQGINSVIEAINELDLGLLGNTLSDLLTGIRDNLTANLTTEFTTLGEKLTSNMSDFEKAISNATKGMDLKTATEMAEKLGKGLDDFQLFNGKFYYDNYNDIEQAYLGRDQELVNKLKAEKDATISAVQGLSDLSENQNIDELINSGKTTEEINNIIDGYDFSNTKGINANALKSYVSLFIHRSKEDIDLSFLQWLEKYLNGLYDSNITAIDHYVAVSQAKSGDLSGYAKTSGLIQEYTDQAEKDLLAQYQENRVNLLVDQAKAENELLANEVAQQKKLEATEDYISQARVDLNKKGIHKSQYNTLVQLRLAENQSILDQIIADEEQRNFAYEAEEKWLANGGTSLADIAQTAARLTQGDFTEGEELQLQKYYEQFDDDVEAANAAFIKDRLSQLYSSRAEQIESIKQSLIADSKAKIDAAQEHASLNYVQDEISNLYEKGIYDDKLLYARAEELAQQAKEFNKGLENAVDYKPEDPQYYLEEAAKQLKKEHEEEIQRRAEQYAQEQIELAQAGKFSEITSDIVKQDAAFLYDTYHSINESITNSMISAIGGDNGLIKVTETNKEALDKIISKHGDWLSGKTTIGSYVTVSAENLLNSAEDFRKLIVSSFDTEADQIKALTEYHNNQYAKSNIGELQKITGESSMAYEDILNYFTSTGKKVQDITDSFIREQGLDFDSTGQVIVSNYVTWAEKIETTVNKIIASNVSEKEKNLARTLLAQTRDLHASEQRTAIDGVIDNYNKVTDEQIQALADSLNTSTEFLLQYFSSRKADGTYDFKAVDFNKDIQGNVIAVEDGIKEYLQSTLSNVIDNYTESISKIQKYTKSGTTSRAEMETFAKQFEEITGDAVDIDTAFEYDSEIKAWKLGRDYLIRYAYARGQQLGMIDDEYKDYVEDLLKEDVTQSVQQAIEGLTSGKKDARKQLEESIVNYYANLFNTNEEALEAAKEEFSETSESVKKNVSTAISQLRTPPGSYIIAGAGIDTEGNLAKTGKFAKNAIKAEQVLVESVNENLEEVTDELTTTAELIQKSAQRDIDNILKGGIDAVKTYQKYNKDASQEELEEVFYSRINALNSVVDQVNDLMVGQFVGTEGKLFEVLFRAGAVENGVVQAGFDMVEVYAAIYAEMQTAAGHTTAGLNAVYAKMLTAQDQQNIDIIDALSNAEGMTYDALGEILTKYSNQTLEQFVKKASNNGIERRGFGKIRITDWETFAKAAFNVEDLNAISNTEEYISAFKAYNDGLISMNQQVEKNIIQEIKQIGDAKPGDWLNVSQLYQTLGEELSEQLAGELSAEGAYLDKGILKLSEDANLLQISQILQSMIDATDITEGVEEVHDLVLQVLKSYAEAITKGIQGGLSNVERKDLINKASDLGISIDFTETADGFKLVETSAIDLYYALKNIDSLHAGQIFDALREELEGTRDEFKSVAQLTEHITKIRDGTYAADEKISNARKEQYEAELQIAEEILAVRSATEDDSFKFMEQDIPSGQNNPLNYWNNWKTAFDSIKEGKRTGKMDYKDFYNLITEMGHLSDMMGGKGIQIGKDLEVSSENVAELITKAGKNMQVAKDGSLKVNLKGIGVDFAASAADMQAGVDEGIDTLARSQISMLDGVIQVLETIVAMEKLGDLDTDNDMKITLPELLLDKNGNQDGTLDETTGYITKYGSNYDTIRKTLISTFANSSNEDLQKAYENVKYHGYSIKDILNATEEQLQDMNITGKDLAKLVDGLWQLSISDGWDIDNPVQSLYQLISQIDDFTLSVDQGTHSISMGSDGLEFSIDWDSEAIKNKIVKAAKAAGIEAGKTPEEIIEAAKAALTDVEKNEPITLDQNYLLKVANGDIKVEYDDNDKPKSWIVGNQKFNSYEDSVIASDLYKATGKQITQTEINGGKASVVVKKGETDITVESTGKGANWIDPNTSTPYKSWEALQDAWFKNSDEYKALTEPTEQELEAAKKKWKVKMGFEVAPTIEGSLENVPAEQVKNIQANIQSALENGDWEPIKVAASKLGIELNFDKNGPTFNQQQEILDFFGLKDTTTLSNAITQAFSSLPTMLEGLDAQPAKDVAEAIQQIGMNATTALTEVSKLVTELAKLNTLQSQSNSNNSNVPGPGKEKLTAKQYADKYGKGTIASGGSFEILGGAETSAENTVTDSSTTYTIKVDKVQIDASGASASIAPGTHVKVADDSKVDIENSIMGVPSSLDPLDMTYIPKDLGQQQVPTGMSMTITNPIKAKITALEPILDDATSMGEEISGAIADGISSGESNITNAIGSIRTHIDELGSAATKIFADIKTILGSLQQHVSITGEISFETPFGKIGTKSGFRGENGVVTISVEGQEKIQEAKEEAEKPVSFTVTAIDLASNTIAKIANNLSKLTSKTIEITTNYTTTGRPPKTSGMTELPKATGNVGLAQAKGTLMGELGPELVVSNGRYFVAGQNGAEMVDLADDAIVFNHLQTEQLLKHGMSSGRGRAVTNERNAVAFAQGNIDGGPAMASASAALNALKQLRAMWESLLGASVSDLGKGGGGGGGGDKVIDPKAWIDTVERWYNLMQEIARLEQQITHEEKLRAKLQSDFQKNGKAYYTSQKLSLDSLEQQIQAQEQLNLSREDYLDRRVAALKENSFGKIYQFDPETNQLEFRKDTNLNGFTNAMEFLTDLYGFNEQGKANYTNKQKYEILKANGFGEQMLYKDGMEIKADSDNSGDISDEEWESFYEQATEAFRDRMDEYAQATQSLRDEIQKGKDQLLELQTQVNEILQDMRDNQMDVENKVLDAIVDLREREIDALQDERDKLEESVNKYVDGLSNALDKEQKMYQNQESQNDLDKQRRRLAILQRSGGSASDIANLQNDINQSERDMYFDLQQQQIDAIQEASQLELERMDTQIEIMNETLEFQKEYGLLWGEVYNVMSGSAAQITDFISGNSEFWSKSPLATSEEVNKIFFGAEQWTSYRDNIEDWNKVRDALFNQIKAADKKLYDTSMRQEFGENYDPNGKYAQIFEQSYNKYGDVTKASTAARSAYTADKLAAEEAERKRKEENERKRREQEAAAAAAAANQSASASNGGDHTVAYYEYNSNKTKVRSVFRDGTTGPWKDTQNKAATQSAVDWIARQEEEKKKKKYSGLQLIAPPHFASGGYVNHGIYELGERGTETVLTASQTKVLRDNILSNRPSSLISLLKTYNEGFSQNHFDAYGKEIQTLYNNTSNNSGINIENATVNMNVQQLANDYDAKRAGEQALAEIMRIARKTSANNSIRR